jgi:hypothetical protein
MTGGRITRTFAVVAAASLIVGAFAAGPADAKKKKKKKKPVVASCPAFTPGEVASGGSTGADAAAAPVVQVTDAHTAEAPLVIEYEHGPAFWETASHTPIQEDTKYFNVQVDSANPAPGLYARIDWAAPSPSDIDFYQYDDSGAEVATSGAANAAPVDAVVIDLSSGGNGGDGFESIPGYPASDCAGYTFESQAFTTPGEAMTISFWLGEVTDTWTAPAE